MTIISVPIRIPKRSYFGLKEGMCLTSQLGLLLFFILPHQTATSRNNKGKCIKERHPVEEIYFNRVHAKSVSNPLPFQPGRCFLRTAVSLLWSFGVMFCSLSLCGGANQYSQRETLFQYEGVVSQPSSGPHAHVVRAESRSSPVSQTTHARRSCQTVYSLPSLSSPCLPLPPLCQ